ncbi:MULTISPECIES: hypothetical protein [Pasteurellaceae]|uniref:NlpE C-terminal OB domain-containing protein n=1 Tax=Pasteurella atlantica TaxID=2827233 RepID=A0AAW8CK44_9PAST|nr:hypothetical protein [Pasteurella atlantica]MBR0572604.1 hypothetical protein [Pasteurella atlantica]MDP8038550.1 hypothetical protein [Pasteurella atlantica]MDP8040642.1 hypothetical protein [Pasteurella atlantica]MDP8042777.1 hypothetical protein [Pasteurella atlantica]MDP8044864.1 hypothetical protein [Pasteurella atlantica]
MKKIHLILPITIALSGCNIAQDNTAVQGLLTFGHEVSSFEPCGSEKAYWIIDPTDKLNNLYNEKLAKPSEPYTPVLAELVLKDLGKATEGFAEDYDSVVEAIEIKSVQSITGEISCRK